MSKGELSHEAEALIDAFALRQGSFRSALPPQCLTVSDHTAGPRLVYTRSGGEWIIAAWLLDDIWITKLWDVRDTADFQIFYEMSKIHKALRHRLSKLKVDWGWFGQEMTEASLAEKLLIKVTKGIS